MTHTSMLNFKKYYLPITALTVMTLSGCTSATTLLDKQHQNSPVAAVTHYEQPTQHKQDQYQKTMRKVAAGIKDDPNYRRIDLNTDQEKEWFKTLTYRLWDRQITRFQFVEEGLAHYPSHRYEFEFIINGFASVCD